MGNLSELTPRNASDWFTALAVAFFIFLVVRFFATVIGSRRSKAAQVRAALGSATATIIEEVRPTAVGGACLILLTISTIGAIVAYHSATTVFQQIEAGVAFVGSTLFFGLGIIIGRKRVYRIYQAKTVSEAPADE